MRRAGGRGADNQSPNFYELDFILGPISEYVFF